MTISIEDLINKVVDYSNSGRDVVCSCCTSGNKTFGFSRVQAQRSQTHIVQQVTFRVQLDTPVQNVLL